LLDVIRLLLKWRKPVLIVTMLAAIVSAVGSLLLPNKYKSTAAFYPTNIATYDRLILFSTETSDKVLNYFGDKNDINRMLSIANSEPLLDRVIEHFDLEERYEIDTTARNYRFQLLKVFKEHFEATKSKLGNIEVSVWDKDPQFASDVATFVMERVGEQYAGFIRSRNEKIFTTMSDKKDEKAMEMQILTDSLSLFDNPNNIQFKTLSTILDNVINDFNTLKTLYDQYEVTANQAFSAVFVIEVPKPALKKDKPVRSVIVAVFTGTTFLLMIILVLIIEKYREIKPMIYNVGTKARA